MGMLSTRLAFVIAMATIDSIAMAADDAARLPVQDFRPLLVKAIDADDGTAHGILVGPMADALSASVKSSSPVLVEVTTLRRYRQAGCSRLNVRFSQDAVHLPKADRPRRQTFDMGLNFCRDGQPPKSLA